MYKRILIAALALTVAYGCSSGVKREPIAQQTKPASTQAVDKLSSVSISLTEEAKGKVADNLKFDKEELLSHVKRALDAHAMLLSEPHESAPGMEIEVKDFRVRTNFSAVMWGFMAGSDSITGDVVLKDSLGGEVDRFEVSVSYALGGLAGGQDGTRMSWLYEKFAEETLKELNGKK
ncbi:MAG: DUF4410 domain-containing protein [Gammaproteobacteria bacterium]|nr:DUF4410 domain-containing protein [Gammaproteobacteria bacterium]